MSKEIVFVCAGNTCRSPMAEFILKEMRPDLKVRSAGIYAIRDSVMSSWTKKILLEQGISEKDLSRFRTTILTKDDLKKNNIIYVMTEELLETIKFNFRTEDVFLLGGGIPDPFGGNREEYELARDKITEALEEIFLKEEETA